ncbi:MAG: amidohydrolase family protein, partial [Aquincola sp.]|nr:amidohydrolase family protein [Aquincola sp.]
MTPAGLLRGRVVVDGERIVAVEGKTVADDSWRAGDAPVIVPGFIDLHVHGGGGADTMEGGGAIDTIARTHLRHGTTSL